ncbi:photosynthetic NDH subunit of subcomplex B 3, chloroplastic [Ipomoea triloba]|uniref:photosynthetic NDH subunit of subcomplex B 3, chloroplastic n=1 Tax=Ipomoea triloba TaxID=35885 RepID=UPI00125DDE4C|nr:photosynthetic NDH subunit of subcomplex B 3, chloroplastic [Ipomoea triloba]
MNTYGLLPSFSSPYYNFNNPKYLTTTIIHPKRFTVASPNLSKIISGGKIRASAGSVTPDEDQEAMVKLAFVHSVLFPDGSPDVHYRKAKGGQKLRDIMLDGNVELYGPYSRALCNCAGLGTCGTCMVEVVEGKELLSPRTDKENEKLKRKPRNWRLACQTTVGTPNSKGTLVIQQLPEWKGHEWNYKELKSSGGGGAWAELEAST